MRLRRLDLEAVDADLSALAPETVAQERRSIPELGRVVVLDEVVVADHDETGTGGVPVVVHVEEGEATETKLEAVGGDTGLGTALVEKGNDVGVVGHKADHVDAEDNVIIEEPRESAALFVVHDAYSVEFVSGAVTHALGLRESAVKVGLGARKREALVVSIQTFVGHEKVGDDHGLFVDGVERARAETEIVGRVGDQFFGEGVVLVTIGGNGHGDGSLEHLFFGAGQEDVLEELEGLDVIETTEGALSSGGGERVDALGQLALGHSVGNGGGKGVKVSIIILGSQGEGIVDAIELVVEDDFGLAQAKKAQQGQK